MDYGFDSWWRGSKFGAFELPKNQPTHVSLGQRISQFRLKCRIDSYFRSPFQKIKNHVENKVELTFIFLYFLDMVSDAQEGKNIKRHGF